MPSCRPWRPECFLPTFGYSLAITPDAKTLVSGSSAAGVRVWDVATGKPRAVRAGHMNITWSLAMSPEGTVIASASDEQAGSVREINTAVGHVDELTQQNSSLVEQAAAAAESMRDQARELARQVEVFRIA